MSNAPICPVSRDEEIGQPAPSRFPAIPLANDLQSAISAVNAMRQVVMALAGMLGNNAQRNAQNPMVKSSSKSKDSQSKQARFVEVERVRKKERVTNPQDHDQYVDIERITKLIMRDVQTGETWNWND